MKKIILFIPALMILGIFYLVSYERATSQGTVEPILYSSTDSSFAVVELFTSQGCSSCPPADRVLSGIIKRAEEEEVPIFALSFHVDYWNYLGWKDPYSNEKFSQRQRLYDKELNTTVYTPQMIINGKHAFVGSRFEEANNILRQELKNPARFHLYLEGQLTEDGKNLAVDYTTNAPQHALLNLALAQKQVSDQVMRGENRGRLLNHHHVVRNFVSTDINSSSANVVLKLPKDVPISEWVLVGYIQDRRNMEIGGAAQIELN